MIITEEDKIFIESNRTELEQVRLTGVVNNPDIRRHLQTRFPFDCWKCPRQIKMTVLNYLNAYVSSNKRQ